MVAFFLPARRGSGQFSTAMDISGMDNVHILVSDMIIEMDSIFPIKVYFKYDIVMNKVILLQMCRIIKYISIINMFLSFIGKIV